MANNNVIPFKRTKRATKEVDTHKEDAKYGKKSSDTPAKNLPADLIDMSEKRREIIKSERRNVTRTVLSQFIGVFVVLPKWGLQPVSVYDISESGVSFDMLNDMGSFEIGEAVTLRIYLSHDSYFTFSVDVANVRKSKGEGTTRHGSIFKKNDDSYKTLFFFAKFLENVGRVVRKDNGDKLLGRVE